MIDALIQAAQTEVDNHSIYVWGGSGQLCCEVSEDWIRRKEKGRKPDEAVKAWEEVENSPYHSIKFIGEVYDKTKRENKFI